MEERRQWAILRDFYTELIFKHDTHARNADVCEKVVQGCAHLTENSRDFIHSHHFCSRCFRHVFENTDVSPQYRAQQFEGLVISPGDFLSSRLVVLVNYLPDQVVSALSNRFFDLFLKGHCTLNSLMDMAAMLPIRDGTAFVMIDNAHSSILRKLLCTLHRRIPNPSSRIVFDVWQGFVAGKHQLCNRTLYLALRFFNPMAYLEYRPAPDFRSKRVGTYVAVTVINHSRFRDLWAFVRLVQRLCLEAQHSRFRLDVEFIDAILTDETIHTHEMMDRLFVWITKMFPDALDLSNIRHDCESWARLYEDHDTQRKTLDNYVQDALHASPHAHTRILEFCNLDKMEQSR